MPGPIRLYWYQSGKRERRVNFGDDLSPLLVRMLSGRDVEHAQPHMADLLAVGSVLQHLGRNLRKPRCWKQRLWNGRTSRIHVWGSGAFGPGDLPRRPFVRLHALRGPRTREAMGARPDLPLGDPGLLVDRLDLPKAPRARLGIVPHVDDAAEPGVEMLATLCASTRVVDLRDPDIGATVAAIRSCDVILSSSLHGLIAADAFGVPNVWVNLRDRFYGGEWKFRDHFAAVGRSVVAPLEVRRYKPPPSPAMLEQMAGTADSRRVDALRSGLVEAFAGVGF